MHYELCIMHYIELSTSYFDKKTVPFFIFWHCHLLFCFDYFIKLSGIFRAWSIFIVSMTIFAEPNYKEDYTNAWYKTY